MRKDRIKVFIHGFLAVDYCPLPLPPPAMLTESQKISALFQANSRKIGHFSIAFLMSH
jgi:hypothetical protein